MAVEPVSTVDIVQLTLAVVAVIGLLAGLFGFVLRSAIRTEHRFTAIEKEIEIHKRTCPGRRTIAAEQ